MKKINIIIPSGGLGTRFNNTEFKELKPFIKFCGKTMFEHIIHSLKSQKYDTHIYIIIQEKFREQYLKDIEYLEKTYNVFFYYINKLTEGTTATSLFLYDSLNNDTFTLLMNCDQLIDIKLDDYIDQHVSKKADGSMLVFDKESSEKWSFVNIENEWITNVAAKKKISDTAVCGWYAWTKGSDFIKYGIKQIINQDKVNGEYYLCPVFNYAIGDGKKILPILVDRIKMHGLGTPEDLRKYISNAEHKNNKIQ